MEVEFFKSHLDYIKKKLTENRSYSYRDHDMKLHSSQTALMSKLPQNSTFLSENALVEIYSQVRERLLLSPRDDDNQKIKRAYGEIYKVISKELIFPSHVRAFARNIENQIYQLISPKTTDLIYLPITRQATVEQNYLKELKYFLLTYDKKIEPIRIEDLLKVLDILNQRIMQSVKYNVELERKISIQYREFAIDINKRVQTVLTHRVQSNESANLLKALKQMTIGDIRRFLTRFNQRFGRVKSSSSHHRFKFETKYLIQLQDLFPTVIKSSTLISPNQLEQVIGILHARDIALRDSDFHYTKDTYDPMNLNYIELGYRIAKYLSMPLSHVLMKIDNTTCVNLDYATRKLKFDMPNGRRGLEALNQYNWLIEWNTFRFVPPEFYGIYFWKNQMYTMVGLLAINGVTFDVSYVKNDNCRPVYLLKIKDEVFKSFFTLNKEGKKRALHIKEMAQLLNQKNDIFDDSKSLSLRMNASSVYRTAWAPIESRSVPYWKDKGRLEHRLILRLVEYYLDTDPLLISDSTLWLSKLNQWCDDLLLQRNSKGEIVQFRSHEDVNCIYGQVVVNEKSFLYEHIVSLIKDSSETNIDNHVHKIAAWYCGAIKGDDANDLKKRLSVIDNKFTSLLEKSIRQKKDMLSNPKLRYMKLISSLNGVVDKEFYNFNINVVLHKVDAISFLPVSTIPPEDRLLSEAGDVIYDLRSCLKYYQLHGQFRNVYMHPIGWFTLIEKERIRNNERYSDYVKNIEDEDTAREKCKASNSCLRTSTIIAIREFINIVYHFGAEQSLMSLQVDDRVTDEFQKFWVSFYSKLDAEEKKRLNNYQIFNGTRRIRVYDVFANILNSADGKPKTHSEYTFCLNEILHPLFQMVIDYDDTYQFRDHIELMPFSSLNSEGPRMLEVMRRKSHKLECSDNDKESTRKLKAMLIVSNFEHSYSDVPSAKQFWKGLVDHLEPIVSSYLIDQTINNASLIYSHLIEHRVNIEIENTTNRIAQHKSRFSGSSSELNSYLESLQKIKLKYSEDVCNWYELSYLVIHLKKRIECPRDEVAVLNKLKKAYQEILRKFASKIAYLLHASSDSERLEYEEFIEFFNREGIAILAYPRENLATHMLDIEANMIWQNLLKNVTEEQANPLRRFMERATPSNSFSHST